jgi:hypothetical protein
MWCPQCGGSNDDSARFCNACGLDLAQYRQQWQTPGTQSPTNQPPYQQQYQPTYQAPQYRPMASYGAMPRVPSYMGWAIAVLILCFWPTGIAAVVYASQVGNKLAFGDIAGAQESSRKAKMWCWITFIVGIIIVALAIIIPLAVGASFYRSY